MLNINISENALKVLVASYENIIDCTAGDFGHQDEVHVEGITEHAKAGYYSDLGKKGLIDLYNDEDFGCQMTPTPKGIAFLKLSGHDLEKEHDVAFNVYAEEIEKAEKELVA